MIFPEGEMHSQNDTLLPFHAGVVQLAFWALEDLRKAGDPAASVSLLPVALRYFFTQDMTAAIDESLARLERAVRPPDAAHEAAPAEPYARMRRVGVRMLEVMEAEYGLKTKPAEGEADLTPRLHALKSLLLDRAAGLIGVPLPPDATLPERMRLLINAVYAVTHDESTAPPFPIPGQGASPAGGAGRAPALRPEPGRQLDRCPGQLRPCPPDPGADGRHPAPAGNRSLRQGVPPRPPPRPSSASASPIPLAACYDAYRADKRGTVARVTHTSWKRRFKVCWTREELYHHEPRAIHPKNHSTKLPVYP